MFSSQQLEFSLHDLAGDGFLLAVVCLEIQLSKRSFVGAQQSIFASLCTPNWSLRCSFSYPCQSSSQATTAVEIGVRSLPRVKDAAGSSYGQSEMTCKCIASGSENATSVQVSSSPKKTIRRNLL